MAEALVIKKVHIKKGKKSDGIMIFFNLASFLYQYFAQLFSSENQIKSMGAAIICNLGGPGDRLSCK